MEFVSVKWIFEIGQIVRAAKSIHDTEKYDGFVIEGRSADAEENQYFQIRHTSDGRVWTNVPACALDGNVISSFRGKYDFLSNFYTAPILFEGLRYQNNEAAFQSAKIVDKKSRMIFCGLDPSASKRMGRRLRLRDDWETVKTDVMEAIVRSKFSENPDLREKLLATGDSFLVEGNTWGDTCWGICNGKGENRLGKILMKTRYELRRSC